MIQKKKIPSKSVHIKNKYPILVAITYLIFIFAAAFLIIFAVNAGPSILAQRAEVTSVPDVTKIDYDNDFTSVSIENKNMYRGPLILVNDSYECKIDGINLTNLLENSNDTYTVSDFNVQVNNAIIENINNMLGDFYNLAGENDILVNSAYRSTEVQQALYDEEENTKATGAQGEAAGEQADGETNEYVAKPGYSEHQTGYAFDFSLIDSEGILNEYDGTGKYSWINENCCKYGFIVRYPQDKTQYTGYGYEPWHFRYVGAPHASYMVQNNLCLEEYITLLKAHSEREPLFVTDLSLKNWMVYYVPVQAGDATQIPVPKDKEYQVSGNNTDGFIVSIEL